MDLRKVIAKFNHREDIHATAPGGVTLGEYLGKAETDRRHILINIMIRCGVILLVEFLQKGTYGIGIEVCAWSIYAVIVLFPLRHWRDSMICYANGFVCRGKTYLLAKCGKIYWIGKNGLGLSTTYLYLGGDYKRINVSYIQGAKQLFNKSYGNYNYI